jgi:hypothetical protein
MPKEVGGGIMKLYHFSVIIGKDREFKELMR